MKHRAGDIRDCPAEECKKHVGEKHTPGPVVECFNCGKGLVAGVDYITHIGHFRDQFWCDLKVHYCFECDPNYKSTTEEPETRSAPDLKARCAALSDALDSLTRVAQSAVVALSHDVRGAGKLRVIEQLESALAAASALRTTDTNTTVPAEENATNG